MRALFKHRIDIPVRPRMNDNKRKDFARSSIIIGMVSSQYLLNNDAKWNVQINEDIGVIKIKSCGSYTFLNKECCGYWRGSMDFFF